MQHVLSNEMCFMHARNIRIGFNLIVPELLRQLWGGHSSLVLCINLSSNQRVISTTSGLFVRNVAMSKSTIGKVVD